MSCPHQWQKPELPGCPYGFAFATVTWPSLSKPQEWARKYPNEGIITDDDFQQGEVFIFLMVAYGYILYLIVLIRFWELFRAFKFRGYKLIHSHEASLCAYTVLLLILNEVLLKNLFKESRPERSCQSSCGMPSGHSAIAIGTFFLNLFETIARTTFTPLADESTFLGMIRRIRLELMIESRFKRIYENASSFAISYVGCAFRISFYSIFLLPVPVSRVAVRDHTPPQVFCGGFIGALSAAMWFYVIHSKIQREQFLSLSRSETRCKIFIHNAMPPLFVAKRCCEKYVKEYKEAKDASREQKQQKQAKQEIARDAISKIKTIYLEDVKWFVKEAGEAQATELQHFWQYIEDDIKTWLDTQTNKLGYRVTGL